MLTLHQPHAAGPWGDYGRLLAHGMTSHLPRTPDGRLRLERTAPFVPEVFGSASALLVSAAMRDRIERAGLAGASFREVEKARIVRYHWEHWDRAAPEPAEYPEEGEPENYILGRRHDAALSASMTPLFELVASGRCVVEVEEIRHAPPPGTPRRRDPFTGELVEPIRTERRKHLLDADGSDFLLSGGRALYVSDRARELLASEWVTFATLQRA
jgi:hypothetical protein